MDVEDEIEPQTHVATFEYKARHPQLIERENNTRNFPQICILDQRERDNTCVVQIRVFSIYNFPL